MKQWIGTTGMAIDIINYRPSWQKLRVSTLAEYNPYGGMSMYDGAKDGIARMLNYINDADPSKQLPEDSYVAGEITRMRTTQVEEYYARVYRVNRFLVAAHNGMSRIQNKADVLDLITSAISMVEPHINLKAADSYAAKWDWDVVRFELEELWRQERGWFIAIQDDMRERVVEKDKQADEMMTFIAIMKEVNSLGSAV